MDWITKKLHSFGRFLWTESYMESSWSCHMKTQVLILLPHIRLKSTMYGTVITTGAIQYCERETEDETQGFRSRVRCGSTLVYK